MGVFDLLRRLFGGSDENPYRHPDRAAAADKPGLGVEELCRRLAMGHAESKAYIEKMTAIYKELVAGLKK
jgi:hypothetical protein